MRIQYVIKNVNLKGVTESSVKELEKAVILIGRGSASDILLRENTVAFLHARISQKEEKLFIEKAESDKGAIAVNDRIVQQCLLENGDQIVIGDTTLTVSYKGDVKQLIEVRKELSKEEEELWLVKVLDSLDLTKRFSGRSIKLFIVATIFPLALFFLAGPLMGYFEGSWSSGPISNSHKFIETDCKSCHTKVFAKVPDTACSQCHKMGEHSVALTKNIVQNLPFENRCGTCHNEHDEQGKLILTKPVLCSNCHGVIKDIHPKATTSSIEAFDKTHPNFSFLNNAKTDNSKLKLNHQYHLTSIEVDDLKIEGGKRLMGCQDCHVLDPLSLKEGTFKEITFDEFCAGCHKLSVGSAAAMLNVPHEKTQLVRTFLNSPTDFLYDHVKNNPTLISSGSKPPTKKKGKRSRRGRRGKKSKPKPKTQSEWVKKQYKLIDRIGGLTTLENKVFFSAKGGCIECHFLDVEPAAGVSGSASLAAFSLWDHRIRLWDMLKKEEKGFLQGHDDVIHSVQFNSQGNNLLSASRDFSARIWNLEDSEALPLVFKKHTGSVNDAVYFPSEEKIITGADDGKAIIWDVGSQKPLLTLSGHDKPIKKVEINKSGTRALTFDDNAGVILWDTTEGANLASLQPKGSEVLVVRFSSDGKQIVAGTSSGSIVFWSADKGDELRQFPAGAGDPLTSHGKAVTHLELSSDGSKMISMSEDFSAKVWNLVKGEVVSTLRVYKEEKGEKKITRQLFLSAKFNNDGSQVATGSSDKVVRLWKTETAEMLKELKGHENQVPFLFFSKEGSKVVSAAYNNVAIIWDLEKEEKKTLRHGEPALIDDQDEPNKNYLRLPDTLPTKSPRDFTFKGVNHLKHEFLECKTCHESMENSISTLDVSLPPIQTCKNCHEKTQAALNECVYCHSYHPGNERGYNSGKMVVNQEAPLGYSLLKQ